MPKFELQKVAFIDPDNLANTVVLSTILEGAGGATRAFVEESAESYRYEDDQDIKDGQVFTFTMAGKPTSDEAQLTAWAEGTKITISGYAYDKFLQIDNAYITKLTDSDERRVWKISAQKAGRIGYVDGKLDTEFMMSANGLNMHYWQEGDPDMPAGWTKTGGTTNWDDTDKEIDFSTAGVTELYLYREIYLPFTRQVTFFADVAAITDTTGIAIGIVAYDNTGSTIGSEATTDIDSTGVASVSRTLPEGTVTVRVRVKIGENDSISFKNPGLSIGTSTTYISQ